MQMGQHTLRAGDTGVLPLHEAACSSISDLQHRSDHEDNGDPDSRGKSPVTHGADHRPGAGPGTLTAVTRSLPPLRLSPLSPGPGEVSRAHVTPMSLS